MEASDLPQLYQLRREGTAQGTVPPGKGDWHAKPAFRPQHRTSCSRRRLLSAAKATTSFLATRLWPLTRTACRGPRGCEPRTPLTRRQRPPRPPPCRGRPHSTRAAPGLPEAGAGGAGHTGHGAPSSAGRGRTQLWQPGRVTALPRQHQGPSCPPQRGGAGLSGLASCSPAAPLRGTLLPQEGSRPSSLLHTVAGEALPSEGDRFLTQTPRYGARRCLLGGQCGCASGQLHLAASRAVLGLQRAPGGRRAVTPRAARRQPSA